MKKHRNEDWECLADSPEEFELAIKNAVTINEKVFFEKLRHKIQTETAFSNDVLMHDSDNEDGLYILRVCTDDFMIGKRSHKDIGSYDPREFAGLFLFLQFDLMPYTNRHETVLEWLRRRDYAGIKYNANNDYR